MVTGVAAESEVRQPEANTAGVESESPTTISLDILKPEGQPTKVKVVPSYPDKPRAVANLMKGLQSILQSEVSLYSRNISPYWQLDDNGYTLHKHIHTLNGRDQRKWSTTQSRIEMASKELHHDPHILVNPLVTTISLTTHVPPGLSMKDVKLARMVDEILLEELEEQDQQGQGADKQQLYLDAIRTNILETNMDVEAARRSCSCAKS